MIWCKCMLTQWIYKIISIESLDISWKFFLIFLILSWFFIMINVWTPCMHVIYNMCGFINYLCKSCWWCKRSYFSTSWINNVIFPPICTMSTKISCNNWTERKFIIYLAKKNIKFSAKDFEFFLAVSTG